MKGAKKQLWVSEPVTDASCAVSYSAAAKFVLQVGTESILHAIVAGADAPDIEIDGKTHVPDFVPPTPAKSKPTKRCRVCYRSGVRKETRVHCSTCSAHPGLCYPACYALYHSRYYWAHGYRQNHTSPRAPQLN